MWEAGKLDCPDGHLAWRPDRCTAPRCRPRVDKDNFLGMFDGSEECRECGRPFDAEAAARCPDCGAAGTPRAILDCLPKSPVDRGREARAQGLRDTDGEPCAHALLIYSAHQTLGRSEAGTVSLGETLRFFDLWGVDDPSERQILAGWFLELDAILSHENNRHLAKMTAETGAAN